MATGAASLPPHAFATGSAVINMLRQVGLAVGVAVFIAVLGTPGSAHTTMVAYQRGWVVTAALAALGGVVGAIMLRAPRRAVASEVAATQAY
jgi:hypothetical protein